MLAVSVLAQAVQYIRNKFVANYERRRDSTLVHGHHEPATATTILQRARARTVRPILGVESRPQGRQFAAKLLSAKAFSPFIHGCRSMLAPRTLHRRETNVRVAEQSDGHAARRVTRSVRR